MRTSIRTSGKIKELLFSFFLISILFFFPLTVFASQEKLWEELVDRLIDISLAVFSLTKKTDQLLNSFSPLHPEPLGDYVKKLFEKEGIFLTEQDFLEPVKDPYLAAAKILNLIPFYSQSWQKINQKEAERINRELLSVKDKMLLDGLWGKIDMHEHYRLGGKMENFLSTAGVLGISKTIFVPTGWGPDNSGYKAYQKFLIKYIAKLYPDKIIPFCSIDEADPEANQVFEECLISGGKGLKLIGGHPNFYEEPLDSENMYKVYEIAKKYRVPVLIHASIISIPETKSQLSRVLSDFSDVIFIHAHYCSTIFNGINLDQCAELLENHPNLYIDLTMGGGIKRYHSYFKKDLLKIKEFILAYQDRILFGSDIILQPASYQDVDWIYQRMRCDIDLHQEKEYLCPFGEKDWIHQGFDLDKTVLKKLYWENPKKVLGF